MSFIILSLISLLLLTQVFVSDSCSSFSGWKLRNNDHDAPAIVTTTTMKQIDLTTKHTTMKTTTNAATPPVSSIETNIIILPDGEPCPEEIGKEYCYNDGVCYVKMTNDGKELQCACKKPFDGPRCMEKLPDGYYVTKIEHSQHREEGEEEEEVENKTVELPVRDIKLEEIFINDRKPCPPPLDEDHCGGYGTCFMFHFSDVDFFCECNSPYYGERCEYKHFDGYYGGGMTIKPAAKRKRRHISPNGTRRNLEYRRLNAKSLSS